MERRKEGIAEATGAGSQVFAVYFGSPRQEISSPKQEFGCVAIEEGSCGTGEGPNKM